MRTSFSLPGTMGRVVERAIVWVTVVTTIAWSIGLSFLINVPSARAAALTSTSAVPSTRNTSATNVTYTVGFTTATGLNPMDGIVLEFSGFTGITIPAGAVTCTATAGGVSQTVGSCNNAAGTVTVDLGGPATGPTISAATAMVVTVAGITNPPNAVTGMITARTCSAVASCPNDGVGSTDKAVISVIIANPPVLTGGGPAGGQTYVPLDALVDINSDINLDPATVTVGNVSLLECTGTTDATTCPGTTGSNLCTPTLETNTRILCSHDPLSIDKTYRFQVTTGVTSAVGIAISANTTRIFRTSSFSGSTNTTPPTVISSYPTMGMQGVPLNAAFTLGFAQGPEGNLKIGASTTGSVVNPTHYTLFAVTSAGAPTGSNLCAGSACTFTWDSTNRRVAITHPALTASTGYRFTVSGLQNLSTPAATMPGEFNIMFMAGSGSDSTPPTLRSSCGAAQNEACTNPLNGTTGVSRYTGEFIMTFSEGMDPTTLSLSTNGTNGTIGLYKDANSSGTKDGAEVLLTSTALGLAYDQATFVARLSSRAALDDTSGAGQYCFYALGGESGVKDAAGNPLTTTSQNKCFRTSGTADSAKPSLTFADADNFKLVAHFSEPMTVSGLITAGAPNTSNLSLECPTGVTVSLTGKTATYRGEANELEISGLGLPSDQSCRLTITNSTDLAGNAIETIGSVNVANFKVLSSAVSGGYLGGGGMQTGGGFFGGMTGETAGTFWEQPKRCQPRTVAAGKATSLECEFPAPAASAGGASLAIGSTFILTFPSGFTLSTADGATRAVPAAQSFMNADINGPASNAVTIASATPSGNSVTVTTGGGSIAPGDMIRFELDRLTTPSVAASDLRISIIVKDANGLKLGQTIQPMPFSIQTAGSLSISGTVCKGTTSGGACGGGDTAVASAKIFCDQFGGFMTGATASAFMGHQETISAADGTWSITGLVAGQYGCGMPPQPGLAALQDTGGTPPFQQISLTTTNKTGADFKVKNLAGASGKTLTVNITGPATTDLDVFCNAGMSSYEFSAPVMKQVTLSALGVGSTTLQLQGGQTYECGVGPHMAFEQFGNGAPPPPPTFAFMPPKPQQVVVPTDSNPTALTFNLSTADLTITVTVQDGSTPPVGIGNVYVHANPVGCFDATSGAQKDCFGSFAQANPSGVAALKVGPGTYEIGADGPGLPPSTTEIVTITSGTTTTTLKMVKSSTTISGQVLDESGNGIKYAHVNGEKRTITSGTDACDFSNSRPSGGWADSPTDESGNFTLYAAAGTWCVRAFAPSYGEVGTKTVTVASGTSQTGQNLQASSGNFGTISGTVTKATAGVGGAFINCFSPGTGGNGAPTNSDGTYSLKVKLPSSGTATYNCDGFAPGIGQLPRHTATLGGGTTTATVDISTGNPATITVTIANITDAFCDARDSSGFGAPAGRPSSTGVYTINAPAGTYTVRCGGPKYGRILEQAGVVVAAGGTAAVTGTPPTTRTVTGRVTDGTSNVSGATLTFTDTSGKSFMTTTGSQSGSNANLSVTGVPEGTYTLSASKKTYEPATTTATVSGGNLTLSSPIALAPTSGSGGEEVTIPVQADGAAYAGDATVIATQTSGATTKTVVAEIDSTTGNAALPLANGTWSVKAIGDNGKESSASTVIVSGGALSGTAPTLSLATSISGYTQKSASETFSLSGGGLTKFSDFAVAGKTPECNVPASTFSQSDSSTGSLAMKSNPALKDIDPGADSNFVGNSGIDLTPKDANGNAITTGITGSITCTFPYTDADASAAGVAESDLKFGAYNTSSQAWETFATTVDTTNNLITAQVTHFSSFGVIGTAASGSPGASDTAPPAAPTNIKATGTASAVTITWTDPSDSDLDSVEVLRSNPPSTAVSGTPLSRITKGTQRYVDSTVSASTAYTYLLRSRDLSGNTRNSGAITVTTSATAAAPPVTGTVTAPPAATTTAPPVVTTPTTPAPPAPGLATIGVSAGDVVKSSSSKAVYLVGADGKRYAYPNEVTYKSWYRDFSNVKSITNSQLAQLPLGGVVTVRPGTWLVKIESDPKVYAVEPGGVLRWVETETRAQTLFGSAWNRQIIDVPVSYWPTYRAGTALGANVHPTGSLVRSGSQTYYIDAGKKRSVSTDAFAGLGFQDRFVRTLSSGLVYAEGPALTIAANLTFASMR